MPNIYLSPSLQPYNQTILGVSEQHLMNIIADAVEPLLPINGFTFTRNKIGMSLRQVIDQSNMGNYDLHLSIHSNAAPPEIAGSIRGSRMYYYTTSARGRQIAQTLSTNFKNIYPLPDKVGIYPTQELAELAQTKAPAVLIETAFHDNIDDATWIQNNIQLIAQTIVMSICDYFDKSYIPPCMAGSFKATQLQYSRPQYAYVCTQESPLNIRNAPTGTVNFSLPKNTQFIVTGGVESGYVKMRYNAQDGYAAQSYVCVCDNPFIPFTARIGTVTTAGGNLNLRQTASTNSQIITAMPNNTQLIVLGQVGSFYQVNYNGIIGYAASAYIKT